MLKRALTAVALLLSTSLFGAEHVSVILQLEAPPAIESYLAASAGKAGASALRAAVTAARNEIAVVESEQQAVVDRLAAAGDVTILYRLQRLYNGIAVDVDAAQLDALRKLPGVKSVEPIPIVPMANVSSVPLIGGPEVWRALPPNGATGKNIKVGVLDTGLDYLHKDFGGSGDYTGNTGTRTTPPLNDKFAGGVDLAGDKYNASAGDAASRTPKPDADPMDCAGHGSHVAGTIAGYGVTKDHSTYTGGYTGTFDPSLFSIGPGVAPEAKLYPVRIFGCDGSTALIASALEWALDPNKDGDFSDRMDVVNMSVGSDYGGRLNVNTIAADNLARAGCVVVASAGNAGDTYYVSASPAAADHTISVAASFDALEVADGLQIDAPSIGGIYPAHHATTFPWLTQPAVKGEVGRPVGQTNGCTGFSSSDIALMTGKIALLDWTDNDCGSSLRVANASLAGATGVILRHTRNDLDIGILGTAQKPSTLVSRDTGDLILAHLGSGLTATLSGDLLASGRIVTEGNTDLLSPFSSRGPRYDDNAVKPEITAPGQTIFSVRALSGSGGVSLNGTSMSAPHVTGAMALLKQIHPDWSADDLKALAMSTAWHDLFVGQGRTGARYAVSRVGAGRIDVASAARANAFQAASDPAIAAGLVGLSFGAPEVTSALSLTRTAKVVNRSANPITYSLAYDAAVTQPGVTFTVPPSITVPANGSATYAVQLTATAPAMRHVRDASLTEKQFDVTRSWLSEASGWVTLTAAGQETLRLPVFAAPRPASTMSAVERNVPNSVSGTVQLRLSGTSLATGNGAEDVNAIVSAYELANQGTRNPNLAAQQNIEYTGITTDFAAQKAAGKGVAESTIYFAVATFGPWTTPFQTPLRIDIDTNLDGVDDFRVTTGDLATFTSSAADNSDVFISIVCTPAGTNCKRSFTNGVDASLADMVTFNSNVLVLPVRAADIGLSSAKSAFSYAIRTGISRAIDAMPRQSYDVANPGMSFSAAQKAAFGFFDTPSNTISVAYNKDAFAAARSRGILLLHHHNAGGKREEVVTVGGPAPPRHRAVGH